METQVEIPDCKEDDEATMESTPAPAESTLTSTAGSDDWENLSEDWVSLFLDNTLFDDQSRLFEHLSHFDPTSPNSNDQISSRNLPTECLMLHSTDDPSSPVDNFVLESPSNVVEFGVDFMDPTSANSSASSLTQLSSSLSSGVEIEEGNSDFSMMLKHESNEEDSSGSTSPTLPSRSGDVGFANNQSACNERESEIGDLGLRIQEVCEDQECGHGNGDDEKRRTRLMRNRESAQLSRQRRKVYVGELEGTIRTMRANVAELNATICHLTTENVNLRRQLGYYFPAPGVCLPRIGMPMHVLPIGPYHGMVAGRPLYSGGHIPIPRMKTQIIARSSKRTKFAAMKEGVSKKRTKLKAAGATSMAVVGLLCVAMVFGTFDHGFGVFEDYSHLGNVRVGGRVLASWNTEAAAALNTTGFEEREDYGTGWAPLEPGEYGPEREGVPSVHTQMAIEAETIAKSGFESSVSPFVDGNATVTTSTSPDNVNSVKTPPLSGHEMALTNASHEFAASVFIPGANGLVKVDGNLIIRAVMAANKAARNQSGRKRKSMLKERKEHNQKRMNASALNKLFVKAHASTQLKAVINTSSASFATARGLSRNVNSVVETNNPTAPALQAGSLQRLMLGGLQDSETEFVARELSRMLNPQPHTKQLVENSKQSKAVAASQGTSPTFTPYDAAPRGPLSSWLFSGLTTEPLTWARNGTDVKAEGMPSPLPAEERVETSIPAWELFTNQESLQRKTHEKNTCRVPTLSNLFWATAAAAAEANTDVATADSPQCLAADRPVLSTGMCTELFQFDTRAAATTPTSAPVDPESRTGVAESVSSPLVPPRSRRDPFAVPLPPVKPKREERGSTGAESVGEAVHKQNLRHRVSSMVVSVLAGPEEEYATNGQRKGSGNGSSSSRIFVVVLVDNHKYVTYSCLLPSSESPAHVVAD